MKQICELSRYQQCILLALAAMLIIFTVLYAVVSTHKVLIYQSEPFDWEKQEGIDVYTGVINGQTAEFIVTGGSSVTYRYGGQIYGPYTVAEDPTAIPENDPDSDWMTGIVIREGDEELFRGGCIYSDEFTYGFSLYTEDGWYSSASIFMTAYDGTIIDESGNVLDPMKPSIDTIMRMVTEPGLTSKVNWGVWFCGVLCSVMAAGYVLFADALFQLRMSIRVRYAGDLEPSGWELAQRTLAASAMTLMALTFYIGGLL